MFKEIPTNGEIAIKKVSIDEINSKYRIKHTDEVKPPDVVLSIGGKIVSTRKNIFGITGKAKVGKSFLMTLINSIVLKKGEMGTLSSYLPKGKDKIAYIDTEQSAYHIQLMLLRVNKIVEEHKMDNLFMYNLDSVPTSERYNYVETIVNDLQGVGLVIIDGIADLVKSVNDEIIACDIADTLRRWATINDIAIGYVLHQNPTQNEKMRGHLGTVLMNKSETVIQISSSKEDESVKLVETTQTRNAKPDNWSFEIIDGMPVIQDVCYEQPKAGRKVQKALKNFEKYGMLSEIFVGVYKGNGIGYSVLMERLKEIHLEKHGTIGDVKIKELIKYCKEMTWIVQDGSRGNYFLHDFKE